MRILFLIVFLNISACYQNLLAQYDSGTIIYNQTSSTNLTSISKNYIVEDFDGDFNADVIMVKGNATNNSYHLTWYKGNGSGNFIQQANLMNVNILHHQNEIFYEDINKDGNKDIVFQNSYTGFKILLNDGQGNISNEINNTSAIGNLVGADLKEIADVDGDGDIDAIFFAKTDSISFGQNMGHCLIGYNNGTGTFSNHTYLNNNDFSIFFQVETGDIDGDGDLDIICNGMNITGNFIGIGSTQYDFPFVFLYKNTGSTNYAPKEEIDLDVVTNYSRITYINIKMQDLNADSDDELLIEYHFTDNCEDELHWWGCEDFHQFEVLDYNTQNSEFVILEHYNTWLHGYEVNYDKFYMQYDDQNADNNLDILSVNVLQGKLHWYYGDGNGGFNNGQTVNFNNQYSSSIPAIRVADIDNDTDLDVFVLLNDGTSSNLTVFQNLELTPSCAPVFK